MADRTRPDVPRCAVALLLGTLALAACGPSEPPSTSVPPTEAAAATTTATTTMTKTTTKTTTTTTTPVARDEATDSVAGRYRLMLDDHDRDDDEAPEIVADYYLALDEDGAARFEAEALDSGDLSVEARGTWTRDGEGVVIELDELLGQALDTPDVLRYAFRDGFPVATDYSVGGTLLDLEEAEFTIGAGERHPLVGELHQRLAAVDYIDFRDPGDDLFTEDTRQAVVAFQRAQGLLPDGEVNPATWVLLGSPPAPVATPTPLPRPTGVSARPGVPDLEGLPTHTEDGEPILYLTFDDGPDAWSQRFVDLLARYDAQATFFVIGQQVGANRDLVRAMAQEGHYVANHTYSHPSLAGIGPDGFIDEVESTRQAILDAALDLFSLDRDVRYLRPPYGASDENARRYAADLGYAVVLWDVDPQDWRRPGADVIAQHVISHAYPGAIVLMHDGGGERSQTLAALETILRELSGQGYVFRSVFMADEAPG